MACDTQYSVMSTGSLYCLGISPHMLNADAFLFFPFFFLSVDGMLIESMTIEPTDMGVTL